MSCMHFDFGYMFVGKFGKMLLVEAPIWKVRHLVSDGGTADDQKSLSESKSPP